MTINPAERVGLFLHDRTGRRRRWLIAASAVGLLLSRAGASPPPLKTAHTVDRQVIRSVGPEPERSPMPAPEADPESSRPTNDPASPRVASVSSRTNSPISPHINQGPLEPAANATSQRGDDASTAIRLANQAIADCQERYRQVRDYTCTFVKREKVDGRLYAPHVMSMKARSSPHSLYFKFQQPNRGREAIYVQGRNNGRVVVHDVGLGKLLAGTMYLDPGGAMAMADNLHPITDAGIGAMIDTVARHWAVELTPGESIVMLHHDVRVGSRPCTLIESVHPRPGPHFLFHKVKLYIDIEHGLPIHFEAYDWPKQPGATPDLVEEYSYRDLKTNVGLRDHDFDPSNAHYSFGRL